MKIIKKIVTPCVTGMSLLLSPMVFAGAKDDPLLTLAVFKYMVDHQV